MKITCNKKITAATATGSEMLEEFKDKLNELDASACTKVTASSDELPMGREQVTIYDGDDQILYQYDDGDEEIVSLADLKEEWNFDVANGGDDYCIAQYSNFEDWFDDTKQWMHRVEDDDDYEEDVEASECTKVTGASEYHSGEVEIFGEDYNDRYEDVGGGFGEPGKVISVADMKQYWNENRDDDPVLSEFRSFEEWFENTRDNFLVEV